MKYIQEIIKFTDVRIVCCHCEFTEQSPCSTSEPSLGWRYAQLLACSASWQGSVCFEELLLDKWPCCDVIVSVDELVKYSSSCVIAVELSCFLTKKSPSSSEWSDAWSSGVASCIAVRCYLNLKPFLDKNRNIVNRYGYRCCPRPISSSLLSTLLSTFMSTTVTCRTESGTQIPSKYHKVTESNEVKM